MLTTKYAKMTKDEAIKAILEDHQITASITISVQAKENIARAMEEAFREGFLRGEQFAKEYYPCKSEEVRLWESDEITDITIEK